MHAPDRPGILSELAEILAGHGRLRCTVEVESGDEGLDLRITVPAQEEMETLELAQRLRYFEDVCTMRALARRYDIDPAALEALLPKEDS